jgi:prepilin-type N-terminal cleavage/methylation domain-containing protein
LALLKEPSKLGNYNLKTRVNKMVCLRRASGVTLIEMMVSILIMAIISAAIASTFYVARNYYFSENQRIKNQQGASLFLLALEKTIRKASSAVVYDDFTHLLQVPSGTCLKLVDYNGTPTDFTDDTTCWFYLSGNDIYRQVTPPGGPRNPELIARNINPAAFIFTQNNLYIQTYFETLANEAEHLLPLSYQTGIQLRN